MSRELLEDERELILNRLATLDNKMERQFLHIELRLGEVEQFSRSAGRTAGFKSGALSTSIAGIAVLISEVIRHLQ